MSAAMRVGIDSYSYHRLLGGLRPGELESGVALADGGPTVVRLAREAGADFVSLETMFLGAPGAIDVEALRRAAGGGIELGLSWGGLNGLAYGADPEAAEALADWIAVAAMLDCRLLRIVVAGPSLRGAEPVQDQLRRVAPVVREACDAAGGHLQLAIENHGDLNIRALIQLVEDVGSDRLGICYDTANAFRVGDDPVQGALEAAQLIRMVHLKDCTDDVGEQVAGPLSVAFGAGVIPLDAVLECLLDRGFTGPWCVELGQLPAMPVDEIARVREDVAWLRRWQQAPASTNA